MIFLFLSKHGSRNNIAWLVTAGSKGQEHQRRRNADQSNEKGVEKI
jgi:hypothetical protein